MGVNQEHIIIAGVLLPFDFKEYEELEPWMTSYWRDKTGFGVVYDGMSGNYIIAGHIVGKTFSKREFIAEGPLDLTLTEELKLKVQCDLLDKLGLRDIEIKLYYILHHT